MCTASLLRRCTDSFWCAGASLQLFKKLKEPNLLTIFFKTELILMTQLIRGNMYTWLCSLCAWVCSIQSCTYRDSCRSHAIINGSELMNRWNIGVLSWCGRRVLKFSEMWKPLCRRNPCLWTRSNSAHFVSYVSSHQLLMTQPYI